MALSLENANNVWHKVKASAANAYPGDMAQLNALKRYLSQHKLNKDLQFVPFTEVQCDVAGGTVVVDAACTLYAIWIKKDTTATDNWFWAYDDATNDGTAADAMFNYPLLRASEHGVIIQPDGFAMGTGIVVTQYATDPLGASDGSDGGNGFIIIGAAA